MSVNTRSRQATLKATNLLDVVKQQGRTLTWLGRHWGVSRSQVSKICSGRHRVTPEVAHKSSELLGVPVQLLFAEDAPRGDAT